MRAIVDLYSKVVRGDAAGFGKGDLKGDGVVLAESAKRVVGPGGVVPRVAHKGVLDGTGREAECHQAGNEQCRHDMVDI